MNTSMNHKLVVFMDLETSGLGKTCEILEIGAVFMNDTFRRYILPKKSIDSSASRVNGLTIRGNRLHYRGKEVQAIDCRKALEDFFDFLRDLSEKCNKIKIILAAHNGHRFDFKLLFQAAASVKIPFNKWDCIDGCLDTYPLSKFLHPNLASYKQEYLKLLIKIFPDTESQLDEVVRFIKFPSHFY